MANASTDWFVVAGAPRGDGSRGKPFHDPWLALHAAGPGDVIHIAAGVYFGRYDRSSWVIDCPQLTLRGGYNQDFSRRAPWETPSVLAAFPDYEAARENNTLSGRGDHSGLVLDGLCFDAAGRNTYEAAAGKPVAGIRSYPAMDGVIASFSAAAVTIRNCVFANSGNGGIELGGDGSRFENNLVINIIGLAMLDLRSGAASGGQPITVAGNAFCFAHDVGPPCGTGGDRAIGVRVNRSASVQENVFVSCGNAAIGVSRDLDRVSIGRNVFYITPRDVVNSRAQGATADITEGNIDELEDVGLKSAAGNVVQDPGMTGLRTEWLDAYSRHLLANYVKPPLVAANAVRVGAGLPALGPADLSKEESKGAFAPRLAPVEAIALRFKTKQGFHPVELAVEAFAGAAAAVPVYRPVDWSVVDKVDATLAGLPVELRVGLGLEQNSTLLADAPPETHMGIRIYRPGSDEGSIFVLARRNTLVNRQFEAAITYNNGREVESTYFLRGVYRTDIAPSSRQQVTLVVESIVPAPLVPVDPPPRPLGRDWFVKAGASGGDGTREKPFRDPFQALDKAEGGDAIHVTGGDYFGKLHSGKWKILIRNLTLLGGYDAEFAGRDPWVNPTRFVLTAEERAKGTPEGTILGSEENSEGLVLDGFIFDGASYNAYAPGGGSLDLRASPLAPLVSLRGGRAPITVRNCLFINACGAGIDISCPFGVFENNIVVNTSGWALRIRADGPGPWVVRNNSVLFACDPTPRAGTGQSSSDGTLFHLTGRAVVDVESNIFSFGDNYGVRATIPQQNVSFDRNVFAANLFNHLTDTQYLWADGSDWERRAVADSGYASFSGNALELPALPVDSAFADAALTRLFGLPSRVSAGEWRTFAARAGASVVPPGGAGDASGPAGAGGASGGAVASGGAAAGGDATGAGAKEAAKPAAPHQSSLADLLAGLSSVKETIKKEDAAKVTAPAAPLYCPVFDWKKALALAQAGLGPGARKASLTVAFAAVRAATEIQYTPITPQAIDADLAPLDNKPVELDVTDARSSSTNTSYFPAGMTNDDYDAYAVATVSDATRTRIALVVRLDTAVSKMAGRATPADKLRVRGIARVMRNPGAMSIVVDSAEILGS